MEYNAHDVLRKVVTYYIRKHKNFKSQFLFLILKLLSFLKMKH